MPRPSRARSVAGSSLIGEGDSRPDTIVPPDVVPDFEATTDSLTFSISARNRSSRASSARNLNYIYIYRSKQDCTYSVIRFSIFFISSETFFVLGRGGRVSYSY